MSGESEPTNPNGRVLGRYVIFNEIASGGMATIHIGRVGGAIGFARTVAIKRLHAQYAKDPDFVAMFMDEARIAARVRHPNVVQTLDVVAEDGELFLVMDYIQGDSLSRLVKASVERDVIPPPAIIAWILCGALHGLHAAHEAKNEQGAPLHIVHRDVSPQNIHVGVDGIARLLDFGVAKATERMQTTQVGQAKGKIAYMAPEQLSSDQIDRRVDIYAAGVVLWEALTGLRLYQGANEGRLVNLILTKVIAPPSHYVPDLDPVFDEVTLKALAKNPADRYQTAREMALALEGSAPMAMPSVVGEWVESLSRDMLASRAERVAEIESRSDVFSPPTSSGVAQVRPSGPSMPTTTSQPQLPPPPPSQPAPAPMPPPASTPLLDDESFGGETITTGAPNVMSEPPPPPAPSAPVVAAPQPIAPPDPDELVFARTQKWKKPLAIVAGVLALAAVIVIILALTSSVKPQETAAEPLKAMNTTVVTAAAPPPTTRDTTAKTVSLPSTTITPKKPPPPPPPVNCNPPFTTDKQGIKHPKKECM
jgi:serine/threonine-protein kinase